MEVLQSTNSFQHLVGPIGQYCSDYLTELKNSTAIVEEHYVDRDFLIDYTKFYARSFDAPERFTKRLHFFSFKFTETDFKQALNGNRRLLQKLYDYYLGFVVIKPIKDQDNNPLIGRTVLKTYPQKAGNHTRKFLTHNCKASLYGIPLNIDSLPFQTQDEAVAACATTALWVCLHPLSILFGVPLFSPAEITERSVTFPGTERNFPSLGLNLFQMINFINFIGLDTENINILEESKEIIPHVVRSYINAGIPIIACLTLREKEGSEFYHAAVVTGYRSDANGDIVELYVHDDQIGPYSRVKSKDGLFLTWENEWIKDGFQEVIVNRLLVPVYPKIRLTFGRIYRVYLKEFEKISAGGFKSEFFLTQVNQYKHFLLDKQFKNKADVLLKSLPRFLWIIRAHLKTQPMLDMIYDGTEVFPKKLLMIDFSV